MPLAAGLGAAALSQLTAAGTETIPHFAPKAKRAIYLFQFGGPSQIDLFDPKPALEKMQGKDLPASIRMGQRLTAMTATQTAFPVAQSIFPFKQRGESGAWMSDLLPYTAKVADELCMVRSLYTEAINHDPAITFFQTGAQLAGRPSIGSWLSYGLGSENANLPAFVALISGTGDQPLYERLWGSGFLPTKYQGVKFRSLGDPVLFLSNPEGLSAAGRRRYLDDLGQLNQMQFEQVGDPEIATRIAQYEMAYRMQSSVPELTDLRHESAATMEAYGPDVHRPGSYAANCLQARRLLERGVRFVTCRDEGDRRTTE